MISGSSGRGGRIGRLLVLAVSLAAAIVPQAAAAEPATPSPRATFREALRTFAGDGRYLLTFPARASRKGAWMTAGFVAATALAMNRDEEIRANVVESDRPAAGRIATKLEPLGRIEVEAAALGTLYLAGRTTRMAIGKGIATRHSRAGALPAPGATWNIVRSPAGTSLRITF